MKTEPIKEWQPCNCIAENEAKIIQHVSDKNPELDIVDGGSFINKAFFFNLSRYGLYHEYKYVSSFQKVNGTMSKPKSTTVSIYPNFCCFCGNPLSDPELNKEVKP